MFSLMMRNVSFMICCVHVIPDVCRFNQQDAQEFLQFLLDGLHDELNLVRQKPPYEQIVDQVSIIFVCVVTNKVNKQKM